MIHRGAAVVIVFLLGVGGAAAQDQVQERWQAATSAYEGGQFAEAIEQYEALLPAYGRSAALHHNLGNCYYRLGQISQAVLHYERALKYRPGRADTRGNLVLARAQIEDGVIPLPGFFLTRWLRQASWVLAPVLWGVLSVLSAWALIGLIIWRMLRGPLQRHRFFLIIPMGLFVITTCLGLVRYLDLHDRDTGVVMEARMTLRAAPDAMSAGIREIAGGEKVRILDSLDHFYKVRLLNYEEGWLAAGAIERI